MTTEKRHPGRPLKNPFPSPEVEEDFSVRGKKMVELYFDNSDPNSRKNFRLPNQLKMSKTNFWSMIYIYYTEEKGLGENIKGYHDALLEHFGLGVAADRSSLNECINNLRHLSITNQDPGHSNKSDVKAHKKDRTIYLAVIRLWSGVV